MKQVDLITIHLGSNFGSILQTIATVVTLQKLSCKVTVINYIPDRCTWKRFILDHLDSWLHFIKLFATFPIAIINKYIYSSYLKKYVTVSRPIYAVDDFVRICPQADVYMTGSDQVWNSVHNEGLDRHYYFDGFSVDSVKIAYASSIGREVLDRKEYAEVKQMLSTYKAISVREASAKSLIESMGYSVTHVLDPTFMLNREEWGKFMSNRLVKQAYLLVYLPYNIHDRNLIYQSVHKIAKAKKLKIVTFSCNVIPENFADQTIFFANPGDFLSLMYYADYVVTNSFHGTAFSVNLNKQFCVYMPTHFGTRISSILELCNLQNCLLQSDEVISDDKMNVYIDYSSVNQILNRERERANSFLKKALEE